MGKKQKKRYKQGKKEQVTDLTLNEKTIDTKDLTDAIVEAYQIIEVKKKRQENELEEQEKKEWQKIIGQKDYPESEKWWSKIFHKGTNYLSAVWTLLFFKKEDVRDLRMTFGLMKLAVEGLFDFSKSGLYIILIYILCDMFHNGIGGFSNPLMAFFIWFLARVFRVASFEVENIKDGNLLTSIFSASISFVAVIVAIVAIFIG